MKTENRSGWYTAERTEIREVLVRAEVFAESLQEARELLESGSSDVYVSSERRVRTIQTGEFSEPQLESGSPLPQSPRVDASQ